MPVNQQHHISLQQQYHHLRRDWDHYKTSIPRHGRGHSAADLPSTTNFGEELKISPKKHLSQQHTAQYGLRLLDAFEKAKEAEAIEIELPPGCGDCFPSSSSPLTWNEYVDDRSSSFDDDDNGWREKDAMRGEKQELMERLRWLGIVMLAVVGVLSFWFVFGVEDVGQLMTPT